MYIIETVIFITRQLLSTTVKMYVLGRATVDLHKQETHLVPIEVYSTFQNAMAGMMTHYILDLYNNCPDEPPNLTNLLGQISGDLFKANQRMADDFDLYFASIDDGEGTQPCFSALYRMFVRYSHQDMMKYIFNPRSPGNCEGLWGGSEKLTMSNYAIHEVAVL